MIQTSEIPDRPELLSLDLPESIDLPELGQATPWERQEILRQFRDADSNLREVIRSATEELNRLHDNGAFSKASMHNIGSRVVQAAAAGESFSAQCNGLIHRIQWMESNGN